MSVRAIACAILAAGLAYLSSFSGVFVFDDIPAIVNNESIRSLAIPAVFQPPADATVSGRPFANFTFALNYAVDRGPFGFHLVNLAIHLGAALLLFGVVRRSLSQVPTLAATSAPDVLACVVSLLWVTHPLHASSVTYIVQRVESLMGLLLLATLYSAIRAGDDRVLGRASRQWVLVSTVSCALGMATKEPMVVAPLLVWLWDIVFRDGAWLPWRNRQRRGIYAALAATWLIPAGLLLTDSQARLLVTATMQFGVVDGVSPLTNLWTQAGVVLHYIRITILPVGLAFDYYGWPVAPSLAGSIGPVAVVSALVVLTAAAIWRRQPAGFAGAFFFLILAPTSSLLPITTEIAAEHRMYLPAAAVIALLVVPLWRVTSSPARPHLRQLAAAGVAASVALAILTYQRNRLFESEERLWAAVVEQRPDNARARINYGIELMKSGREAAAEEQMCAALPLHADRDTRAQILVQLGSSLAARRQSDEGIKYLEEALALKPGLPEAHSILGQTYEERGDRLLALRHFQRSLESRPNNVLTLNSFAWVAATAPAVPPEQWAAAVTAGEKAVRLTQGNDVDAYQALAAAYARTGNIEAAITTASTGLQLARRLGHPAAQLLSQHLTYYESLRRK